MTAAEIIRAHAANQGQNANALATNIKKFLEQPETRMVREGDCMFLVNTNGDTANFYIINGGNSAGYIRALRSFSELLRRLGYKNAAMRVEDKEQSRSIARVAGVSSVSYKEVGGTADPYLMTMEL